MHIRRPSHVAVQILAQFDHLANLASSLFDYFFDSVFNVRRCDCDMKHARARKLEFRPRYGGLCRRINELKNLESHRVSRAQVCDFDLLQLAPVDAEDGCVGLGSAVGYAVASDLLEAEERGVPLDRCVEVRDRDGDVVDDVVVYLGLRGEVKDALRADEDVVVEMADGDLRKTRAGGN